MSAPGEPGGGSFAHWMRTLRTAAHIPPAQLAARASFLWRRRRYAASPGAPIESAAKRAQGAAPAHPLPQIPAALVAPEGDGPVRTRARAFASGKFEYLHRELELGMPPSWTAIDASPLWVYQLQYLGAVRDLALCGDVAQARAVLDSWTDAHGSRWDAVAWHPYPVSLRLVNVCHAAGASGSFDALGEGALQMVAIHAAYLLDHLEHDVRGNHLLENARALVHAGAFLSGTLAERCLAAGRDVLTAEVPEQILADGGHFELAPLYHTIVLQDLLQIAALLGDDDALRRDLIDPAIARMATWLDGMLCPDGDIPLLGDSVRAFGPPPAALLTSAGHVRRQAAPFASFGDTGLHVWSDGRIWAVLDAGDVCPRYLPAHGQADSLTIEVWIDGAPLVTDPGVHDYSGPERAWGRSSRAHSTITLDDADTSEVFASFRVGGRARRDSTEIRDASVSASIRPFADAATLTRTVHVEDASLHVADRVDGAGGRVARSRLHLHPDVEIERTPGTVLTVGTAAGRVRIEAEHGITFEDARCSREFGRTQPTTMLVQELPDGVGGWRIGPVDS